MHSLSTNPSSAPIRDGFLPRRAPCCIRRKVNPGAPSTSRSQTEQKRLLIRHSTIHIALWPPHSWTCEKPPCQRFLTFSNSSRTAIAIGLRAPKTLRLPKRASESSRNFFPVSTSLLTIRQAKKLALAQRCTNQLPAKTTLGKSQIPFSPFDWAVGADTDIRQLSTIGRKEAS